MMDSVKREKPILFNTETVQAILDGRKTQSAVAWFHGLWQKLNAKRGYGWDANPWVWVIEFDRAPEGVAP